MKRIFKILKLFVLSVLVITLSINFFVILSTRERFINSYDEIENIDSVEAVVVLGCGVNPDGSPSRMLFERLKEGTSCVDYFKNSKLFLTGDNSGYYNELATMKRVSLENGVDESRIVIDDFGFSTWESINNAKQAGYKNIVIVTQPYHLYRALYIAKSLGLDAYGAKAYLPLYPRQIIWSSREILARIKDFANCLLNSEENKFEILI